MGDLTKYLLERPSYHGGKSPMEEAVTRELRTLTDNIAREMIAEDPELGKKIRGMVRSLVTQALAADGDLNTYVTQAVSKALATRALHIERMEEEES